MILFYFGDSLTLGCGDPSWLGWPGRISGKLMSHGKTVTAAYNLGVRANTTLKVADRLQREVETRLLPHLDAECRLVFHLGVADVMNDVDPDDTLAAAETILTQAKTFGEVLLIGPTPVGDGSRTERIAAISDRLEALCEVLDVPFVPVLASMRQSDTFQTALADGDSIHPAAMGYAALAECILQSEPARKYFGLE